ncbi:ubiquitin-related modifier 1 [Tricharina praecox]|uniref:ubiquitin-related modifier 1 n=1 Tax=Tricharina praecox TaxID=43433 RepID=UPI00221E74C1|nr:ubiquitin-related modifier 1 [Tricharina praecox]KAI5854920.1 ubiquitin-related modifier 1 [Tricharina praecox]
MTADTLPITVEFSGGLELLFANKRTHKLQLPAVDPSTASATTIAYLVDHLSTLMADSRKELFIVDGTVRPGILVLINDADWELEDEERYVLQAGDTVLFVSTLHGG